MTMTIRRIVEFLNAAGPWLEKHPDDSKFRYAVRKLTKQVRVAYEAHAERVDDLDIEHCAVDPKTKVMCREPNGALQFTKEGIRARNLARKALIAREETLAPHVVAEGDAPDDLTDAERDAFAGFVLPEEPDDVA